MTTRAKPSPWAYDYETGWIVSGGRVIGTAERDRRDPETGHRNGLLMARAEDMDAALRVAEEVLARVSSVNLCGVCHHAPSDRHKPGDICPVEKRAIYALQEVRLALKGGRAGA